MSNATENVSETPNVTENVSETPNAPDDSPFCLGQDLWLLLLLVVVAILLVPLRLRISVLLINILKYYIQF